MFLTSLIRSNLCCQDSDESPSNSHKYIFLNKESISLSSSGFLLFSATGTNLSKKKFTRLSGSCVLSIKIFLTSTKDIVSILVNHCVIINFFSIILSFLKNFSLDIFWQLNSKLSRLSNKFSFLVLEISGFNDLFFLIHLNKKKESKIANKTTKKTIILV